MVTFDAAETGTSAKSWADDPRLRSLAPLDLSSAAALVIVAAHPDDETLGAGGLIALAEDRGIPVTVIVATDGSASHSSAPEHHAVDLRQARAGELRSALHILNPAAQPLILGLPDGGLRERRDELESLLRAQLADMPPATLVVVPWRGDGHRDHRVVGEVAVEVAGAAGLDFLEYPIWMWHWGTPRDPTIPWHRMVGLELPEEVRRRKNDAITEFHSQIQPAFGLPPVLRADFLEHFRHRTEVYIDSRRVSLDASYFEGLYARRADPWRLASRWYETRKRSVTVASLPSPRYRHGLEIGCSIGMLTRELAPRCDSLLAVDIASGALELARERLSDFPQVAFAELDVSVDFPPGQFDLIVVSEVGYYLSRSDLVALFSTAASHLAPGGVIVLCHWRYPVADYPLRGDEVHEVMQATSALFRTVRHEESDFILEVYGTDPGSVAQREGLAP
ncbi:bifunctional PIG-L family deacetylase/class I SAM-dependent methyltransferase [Glaciihabitans sp. INWT7]|uniref:bifunctional PIG-L family deacetylase/class I SAM-dependent methyltransferase n=1 Tax=Glaciihabitans sp. INWT7 TaxID=2596912 RepID=UPI001623D1F2|nr:bifunctional PIG-L family deacetylase/class I SAM-dependent methyltransferase [Glaciihabitans sp. INWT7]QNE45897.1 bifunctional PIG-L family deacetylase/class I SAM-dependent methyltransferase [Glaciihabitans sp. INWT7]